MKPYTHKWWFKMYKLARLKERLSFIKNEEQEEWRFFKLARYIENRMNDKYGEDNE